jgi:acetoacetyl-CoA reductase
MARVAIVTGGTRGIGAAVARALEDKGCRVGAVYHGNVTAAQAFSAETGLPIFKWDVADFDACAAGVQVVERELGPVDTLVNNAGITKDATLHHMTPQQWSDVITTRQGGKPTPATYFISILSFWNGQRSFRKKTVVVR